MPVVPDEEERLCGASEPDSNDKIEPDFPPSTLSLAARAWKLARTGLLTLLLTAAIGFILIAINHTIPPRFDCLSLVRSDQTVVVASPTDSALAAPAATVSETARQSMSRREHLSFEEILRDPLNPALQAAIGEQGSLQDEITPTHVVDRGITRPRMDRKPGKAGRGSSGSKLTTRQVELTTLESSQNKTLDSGEDRLEFTFPQGIPGSALLNREAVRAFRSRLRCLTTRGRWRYDATPRVLPWALPSRWDGGWQCDEGHVAQGGGRVAFDEADGIALAHGIAALADGNPAEAERRALEQSGTGITQDQAGRSGYPGRWRVRESLKYRWNVNSKCGPWREFDSSELVRKLAGRRLLIVGDSLNGMLFAALRNALFMGFNRTPGQKRRKLPPNCAPTDSLPAFCGQWGREITSRAHHALCVEDTCADASVAFVRSDALDPSPNLTLAWPKLIGFPWLHLLNGRSSGRGTRDVEQGEDASTERQVAAIVLNRGAHYTEDEQLVLELNATLSAIRAVAPNVLLIYRNTPPGHAHCKRRSKPFKYRQDAAQLPYHWGDFGRQNELARRVVERYGGVYWDLDTSTGLRPDGHVMLKDGRVDCLHYCLPGPADTWVRMLFNMLMDLL
ncbi:unnamed protein product [Closterium sp. Yama58-4]|nr:unnamed protein product [Closterium sp. Yama58-4]